MMTRRQMLGAAAAGAAMAAGISNARAATHDLLIKGGRVIDPSVGLDAVRDVAIAGGRIVAVEADIMGDAGETIDARGKIVGPGFSGAPRLRGEGRTGFGFDLPRAVDFTKSLNLRYQPRPFHAVQHHLCIRQPREPGGRT